MIRGRLVWFGGEYHTDVHASTVNIFSNFDNMWIVFFIVFLQQIPYLIIQLLSQYFKLIPMTFRGWYRMIFYPIWTRVRIKIIARIYRLVYAIQYVSSCNYDTIVSKLLFFCIACSGVGVPWGGYPSHLFFYNVPFGKRLSTFRNLNFENSGAKLN